MFVIRRRDVDVFPAVGADGATISTPIVPKTGKNFVKWDFAQDTGRITHKSGGDAKTDAVIQAALNGDFLVAEHDYKSGKKGND